MLPRSSSVGHRARPQGTTPDPQVCVLFVIVTFNAVGKFWIELFIVTLILFYEKWI